MVEVPLPFPPKRLRADETGKSRNAADLLPIVPQRNPRLLRPTAAEPVDHNGGIHRTGARSADTDDLESRLIEQPVECPPGKGTMRPASLQSEGDLPAFKVWGICHLPVFGHAASFRHSAWR